MEKPKVRGFFVMGVIAVIWFIANRLSVGSDGKLTTSNKVACAFLAWLTLCLFVPEGEGPAILFISAAVVLSIDLLLEK